MTSYPSPPREPSDLTPPGTPRGRYKIPATLLLGKETATRSTSLVADEAGNHVSPEDKVKPLSVQEECSSIVQEILDEVDNVLQNFRNSEPNKNTLEPDRLDNNLIGTHVQGAARATLAKIGENW